MNTPYPVPGRLQVPITPYQVNGYRFRERVRGSWWLPAWHLGDDIIAAAGTPVLAIGNGQVVWAATRLGLPAQRNWGGLIILGHRRSDGQDFYSVYGHLASLQIKVGELVAAGKPIGEIAAGLTPENGWWKNAHLHFALYIGPWTNQILPGYRRLWQRRTKMAWWANPAEFIEDYNQRRV